VYLQLLEVIDPRDNNLGGESQAIRLKEAADFWLLGQCDGVVLSKESAFADKALTLAMHTVATVRCTDAVHDPSVHTRYQEKHDRMNTTVQVKGGAPWKCRRVQLQDWTKSTSAQ